MGGIALPVALVLAIAGAPKDPLGDGIRLYREGEFSQSVASLTEALTTGRYPKKALARAHVYLGLIQLRFDHQQDARRSFAEALKLSPSIQLPPGATRIAKKIFAQVKRSRESKPKAAKQPPLQAATATVAVTPPLPPPPEPVPPPPPPPSISAPPPIAIEATAPVESSALAIAGWTCIGVGAAGAAGGGVLLGLAFSSRSAAVSDPVATERERLHDEALSRRNAAIGVGVTGVAAIVAGAIMLLADYQ